MMADNEKVIKGLECCFKYETQTASGLVCEECPYNKDDHLGTCTASVLKDACVLIMDLEREIKDLKAQPKVLISSILEDE